MKKGRTGRDSEAAQPAPAWEPEVSDAAEFAVDECMRVQKGKVVAGALSVFSIVRDELYFLPAFLDHYRRLGVEQFLFLDDRSEDGTFEFLSEQPDCVIAVSERRYGDVIDGKRAVHVWKTQIPRQHLRGGCWAICADADEFLFIPPGFASLRDFVRELDRRGTRAVSAAMVDFYPETVEQMETTGAPADRDELFASYPYFDRPPAGGGRGRAGLPYGGVRERLLRRHDISLRGRSKTGLALAIHRLKTAIVGKHYIKAISTTKVPLVKWSADLAYTGSHTLNVPPEEGILLPLAHFKFTSELARKIGMATATRGYSDGSRAYFEYAELLDRMKARDGSFLDALSVRYEGPSTFETVGLMRFPASDSGARSPSSRM